MEELVRTLREGGYSCVIRNGGVLRTFSQRGVADLYDLLVQDAQFLRGAWVADKVVGKAAVALMILGGVERLHTGVISTPALDLAAGSSLEVAFDEQVPHIINRAHDGWCPLERLCYDAATAGECLGRIEGFILRMKPEARMQGVDAMR